MGATDMYFRSDHICVWLSRPLRSTLHSKAREGVHSSPQPQAGWLAVMLANDDESFGGGAIVGGGRRGRWAQ